MFYSEPPQSFSPSCVQDSSTASWLRIVFIFIIVFCIGALSLFALYRYYFLTPAQTFAVGTNITIEEGTSAQAATQILKEAGFVTSDLALYLSLIVWHDPSEIKAGTYRFDAPLSARALASELMTGHFAHDLVRLTLREGERASQYATAAKEILPEFNEVEFLAEAQAYEGKLFPETYLVPETYTADELLSLLLKTYTEKTTPLKELFAAHSLTEEEIIILASIIEREANSEESKRMVSGILQNRLAIGMALQVDASLEYVLDKPLKELTPEDLEMDSPYNTYKHPGLPPTPIGNPGLESIQAVLAPEPSDYYFYITGDDGNFYYAEDFDAHRLNIARHLR